jgi:hypothetical protein
MGTFGALMFGDSDAHAHDIEFRPRIAVRIQRASREPRRSRGLMAEQSLDRMSKR